MATSFQSILYKNDTTGMLKENMPDIFIDLHLDQVVDKITEGKEQYNLKPFFYSPLYDKVEIIYRQEVMKDLEDAVLMNSIKSFTEAMDAMRTLLHSSEKYVYDYQKERAFLDAVVLYCKGAQDLLQSILPCSFQSEGLQSFRDYLSRYIDSQMFATLCQRAENLLADLGKIRYNILINGLTVNVQPYQSDVDYSYEVAQVFERFQFNSSHDYTEKTVNTNDMNHVEASILKGVASLYPQEFQRLSQFPNECQDYQDGTLVRFDREVQFYISYLNYIDLIKNNGLVFCYPELSVSREDIYNTRTFDITLARKLSEQKKKIVDNDFYFKGKERIIIVTGPNQGGKTTFSRTFGQVHYLASLGCAVQGSDARLLLFDHIFTHFERKEEVASHRSKFEDDLIRVHKILEESTPQSIIILNEIFSSTSLEDAIFLCKKIMEKIVSLDLLCVWVTFIDELVSYSDKTVSMVSLVNKDNPAVRTFRLVRKPTDGIAYALSIAQKYKVTYGQLKQRLSALDK